MKTCIKKSVRPALVAAVERQSLLLFGWLLLATTPVAVQAQFTFTTNNGTITITGYTGTASAVDIPNTITDLPVTGIGDSAFGGDTDLASVTIPNSVTIIGWNAFDDCTSLASVTIPNSVTTIGWSAFESCTSLTSVTIPNSVTGIGNYAFSGCISLTSLTIPNSVTDIGYAAFRSCTSLTAISVETNNPAYSSVNGVLFDRSQTRLIRYPGGKAGSYSIPNSVTIIWGHAFEGCTSLTSVTIPNGVTSVGDQAFGSCSSLTSVTIGNNVANIGDYAFAGCTSLKRAIFQGKAPSGDSSVFSSDTNAIAYYLPGTTGWGSTFGGIPTALWSLPYPLILNNSLGVRSNQFGFTIS